jgi:hypothetical protein
VRVCRGRPRVEGRRPRGSGGGRSSSCGRCSRPITPFRDVIDHVIARLIDDAWEADAEVQEMGLAMATRLLRHEGVGSAGSGGRGGVGVVVKNDDPTAQGSHQVRRREADMCDMRFGGWERREGERDFGIGVVGEFDGCVGGGRQLTTMSVMTAAVVVVRVVAEAQRQ